MILVAVAASTSSCLPISNWQQHQPPHHLREDLGFEQIYTLVLFVGAWLLWRK